jgi:hypothetical protein
MTDIGRIYDDSQAKVLDPTAPFSNLQVKNAVEEAIASLQSRGVSWNEILSAMEEIAFDQGNQPIADVLGAAAYHTWQAEAGVVIDD